MDLNTISPYIRVAMDSIIQPPWYLKERVIFDFELLYVKEGKALITIENDVYYANPGDIFLLKPKKAHSIKVLDNTSFHQPHIHFDLFYQPDSPEVKVSFKPLKQLSENELDKFRDDITGETELNLPDKLQVSNIRYFEELLFEIIKEYELKKPFYDIDIKGLFTRLWIYIIRENHWRNNPAVYSNREILKMIRDYLTLHMCEDISMDDLVSEFKISKYHMIRLFRNAYATTPIHLHRMMRVAKVKEMVQFTDFSMTKIAELFGYGSINALSRAFRKIEGVPPTFYRSGNV
ncbi:MAG: AraC family transcriptional regulator [Herbinix sp.]|jgi:AraC-like DNA-binding protein|nr:AraC family transcriptional regulator [Herbinix sp.]